MPLASSSSCRGGQHDRRRRLLTEELSHNGQWPVYQASSDETPFARRTTHYGDAPFLDEPLRLIDLIPCHPFKLLLIAFGCAAVLAGLEAAYRWMPASEPGKDAVWALFDLSVRTSLANWFSILMLLAAGAASCIVYCVRRHRIDDYQGRYRVWIWAAATWFLLAADQATTLREAFREIMIGLTGSRLLGNGSVWWAIAYMLLLGAIGSRLLMDMRPNWTAMGSLILAGIGWGTAAAMQLGWIAMEPGKQQMMVRVGAEMASSLFLLLAMGLHARHVIFDAQGLLVEENLDEADKEFPLAATSELDDVGVSSDGSTWVKIDTPHKSPPPASRRAATSPSPAAITPAAVDAGWSPIQRKLTKDERRALKNRLLRERQERERGK